jgi:ATP-dependent HslUV protease ATP-binding subunit HslU
MDDVSSLTPREIVGELDRYIVGQQEAKRAVAVALRNRWRRQQVDEEIRDEIIPKNIIMIGPTGVGKTEIARRLAKLARAPFIKVEASKFTEIGYVGRDVESMVRDLVDTAIGLVKAEEEAKVDYATTMHSEDRILKLLKDESGLIEQNRAATEDGVRAPLNRDMSNQHTFIVGSDGVAKADKNEQGKTLTLRDRLRRGDFDKELVEIDVTDHRNPVIDVLNAQPGMGDMDLGGVLGNIFPGKSRRRKCTVPEALKALKQEEAHRRIDMDQVTQEALKRTEGSGIIFIDEIDKVVGRDSKMGPDVSREGVQRDLLPVVEGCSVNTKHGVVKTDHILFVAAGAFHVSKPSDLIPELQGRFPIRVELQSLTQEDFRRILTEPTNALTRQYTALLATEKIDITFDPEGVRTIAEMAHRVNESLENIGARRLHTLMERIFEDLSYNAPEMDSTQIRISSDYVQERLEGILGNEDLSRYIL